MMTTLSFRAAIRSIAMPPSPAPPENALLHDWSRVASGIFHDFHCRWITHLSETLNTGGLPESYYALGEQRAGSFGPDVLALQYADANEGSDPYNNLTGSPWAPNQSGGGIVALADAPPAVSIEQEGVNDARYYTRRQRRLAIRHVSGDRVVAMVEILSPGNRQSMKMLDEFLDKVIEFLENQIHVVIIDPFGGGSFDPDGIHAIIWDRLFSGVYQPPAGKRQTLVSYTAGYPIRAWIEPMALRDRFIDMPLFLTEEHYVPLPLAESYARAYHGVPGRWRRVLEVA